MTSDDDEGDNDNDNDNDNEEEHEFATKLNWYVAPTVLLLLLLLLLPPIYRYQFSSWQCAVGSWQLAVGSWQWQLASDSDSMIAIPSANKRGKTHRSPAIIRVVLLSRTRRNTTTVIIGLMIEQNRTESVSVSVTYPYPCTTPIFWTYEEKKRKRWRHSPCTKWVFPGQDWNQSLVLPACKTCWRSLAHLQDQPT